MVKQILFLFVILTSAAVANDDIGKVFFGNNLAKPFSEHTDRLYLKIDDSEKLFFNREHEGPVLGDLNLNEDHIVKVFFDDQIVQSWILNFSKMHTQSVVIWRSSSSWRMAPAEGAGLN